MITNPILLVTNGTTLAALRWHDFVVMTGMFTAILHILLALPVTTERSSAEPVMYIALCILFPLALLLFLKKREDRDKMKA